MEVVVTYWNQTTSLKVLRYLTRIASRSISRFEEVTSYRTTTPSLWSKLLSRSARTIPNHPPPLTNVLNFHFLNFFIIETNFPANYILLKFMILSSFLLVNKQTDKDTKVTETKQTITVSNSFPVQNGFSCEHDARTNHINIFDKDLAILTFEVHFLLFEPMLFIFWKKFSSKCVNCSPESIITRQN